jgi:hypothetical protein
MKNKKFASIFLLIALMSNTFVFPNINYAENEKSEILKERYST